LLYDDDNDNDDNDVLFVLPLCCNQSYQSINSQHDSALRVGVVYRAEQRERRLTIGGESKGFIEVLS